MSDPAEPTKRDRRARRTLARLALIAIGTLSGCLVSECGLRILGFEEEMARQRTVFDPRYGTVREDSWVFDFEVDPGAAEVDLRGQRVPLRKSDGELRVLFIGDSGTEGVRVALEETYPLQLQRMLDTERSGHRARAINAGVFGMTPIDEMIFLETELVALAPDVVVLGLFLANDINFNLGHVERLRTVRPPSPLGRRLVEHSALAHFAYVQALSLNARHRWFRVEDLAEESVVPREVALVDDHGLHMLSYPLGEIATYVQPPSSLVDRAFEVLENVLWRIARLGRQYGFALRVLLIPTPSTVAGRLTLLHHPDIWDELRRAGIGVRAEDLDFAAPTRRVLATCAELGIVCVDPTPAMREIGMDAFFPDDEHPTVTGHAILARALLERWDEIAAPAR